jgi:hypothetical protein
VLNKVIISKCEISGMHIHVWHTKTQVKKEEKYVLENFRMSFL